MEYKVPFGDTYLNVTRFGRGPRVLALLSGISLCGLEGQGEAVAAAYAQFAEEYTCYLFDRRKVLPADFTVADMAEDVYTVLRGEGIESADLFGVSQGGMMALVLARRYPDFVRKLVLGSATMRADARATAIFDRWIALAEAADIVSLNRDFFEKLYPDTFRAQYADLLRSMETIGTAADCRRFCILARACLDFDATAWAGEIACPTLVLGDRADRIFAGDTAARELAAAIPGARLHLYDGYGHAVYDMAPDYKDRVQAFLRE